jgi:hypothetical protein
MGLVSPAGELMWRRVLNSLDSKPLSSYSQTGIYTCAGAAVTMWSILDGQVLWTKEQQTCISLQAVDHNSLNLVAVLHSNGVSFLTSLEGNLSKMIQLKNPVKVLAQVNDLVFVLLHDQIAKITLRTWNVELIEFRGEEVFVLKDACLRKEGQRVKVFYEGKIQEFDWKFGNIEKALDKVLIVDGKIIEINDHGFKESEMKNAVYCENSLSWITRDSRGISINQPDRSLLIEGTSNVEGIEKCLTFNNAKGEILGFVVFQDFSLLSFRDTKVKWHREEGLGHLKQLYFMELPTKEMHSHNLYFGNLASHNTWQDVFSNFLLRVQSQVSPASLLVEPLERDNFGIKKLILAYSQSSYLFAIQSQDSNIYWKKFIPGLVKIVQTGPEEAKVLSNFQGKSKIITLNIIQGKIINEKIFDFDSQQVLTRGENEDLSIHLLRSREILTIYGKSPKKIMAHQIHSSNGTIEGLEFSEGGYKVTWSISLPKNEKIVKFCSTSVGNTHQPAIATGTSRMIYKYLDKNLFAVASLKSSDLFIYIINSISGHIVYRLHQEGVKGPVFLAFHEHKLYTHYLNSKYERFEILSIELFKGEVEYSAAEILKKYYSHGFSTSYSSKWSPEVNVFTQTYIFNYPVKDMKVTKTLQGITKPMLLMVLESGKVYMIDCSLLSPRRKYEDKSEDGLFDEPTLPVYKPLVNINFVNQPTYFLELEGLEFVKTSPTALESTCIGAFFGLDLFVTRIMPEKSFDALTDDFNKGAIVLSIVGLVLANVISHRWFSIKTAKEKFNL